MTPQHEAALAYARRGIPVFPLRGGGKLPLIGSAHPDGDPARGVCHGECGKPGHGLYDATLDLERVRAWWTRWPRANIGVRTGVVFDVLDPDGPEGIANLRAFLAEHGLSLKHAPAVPTPGGGWHVFLAATGLGCKVGVLPKVDWKGIGGYLVAGPSVHPNGGTYRQIPAGADSAPWVPAPLRAVLEQAMAPRVEPARQPATFRPRSTSTGYARAALEGTHARVLAATYGDRNQTLFSQGASLFGLVAGGVVDEAEAVALLEDAGRAIGLGPREIHGTITSAKRRGMQKPRGVPADPPLPPPVPRPGEQLDEDAWNAAANTKPQVAPTHHEPNLPLVMLPTRRLLDIYRTLEWKSRMDGRGRRVQENVSHEHLMRHYRLSRPTVERELRRLEQLGCLVRERIPAERLADGRVVGQRNRYALLLEPRAVQNATIGEITDPSRSQSNMQVTPSHQGASVMDENPGTTYHLGTTVGGEGFLQPVEGDATRVLDADLRVALEALRAGFGEVRVLGVYGNDDPRLARPDVRIGVGQVEVVAAPTEPLPSVPSHRRYGRAGRVDLAACSAEELHRVPGQLEADTCSNGDRCALGHRCRRHTRRVRGEAP